MGNYLKTIITLAMLVCIWAVPGQCSEWDTTEKVLLGTFIAGQVINYGQANAAISDDSWKELNPLIRDRESLICLKLVGTTLVALVANGLSHKWRKRILVLSNGIVWGLIIHDHCAGVQIRY